jgi:hypothetical protein
VTFITLWALVVYCPVAHWVHTGLSESKQIRQGLEWWLAAREWPPRESDAADRRSKIAADCLRKRRPARNK